MIIRSFLLFESLDQSEGLIFSNPFSLLTFEEFPSKEFEYYISISIEDYDNRPHEIHMELFDPLNQLSTKWPKFKFQPREDKAANGVFFKHIMKFHTPGIYSYRVYIDQKQAGKYSLVVKRKEG